MKQKVVINEYTNKLVDLALEIATTAKEMNKDYFFGGGLVIDFYVGKITRNHHDIDFHPMLEDSSWWERWFTKKEYEIKKVADPKFTETYQVKNTRGEAIVDVWPLKLDHGKLMIKYQGKYSDSGRYWKEIETTTFKGVDIKIENPQRVLDQKLRHFKEGQKFRFQDSHDFKLLGRAIKLDKQ
jgi:hypothetical protein